MRLPLFFICLFLTFLGRSQSIDTTIQFQSIEIIAPRMESFQAGTKTTNFTTFQKLSVQDQGLGTALSLHTPIFVKNYGPGRLATTAIRGASAAQTAVIWNGFNLNSPMLGQTDFSLIPAFFMDDIGIQYGSNSASWGSGAVGGAIILKNKTSFDQGWQGAWNSTVGSFGNFFNGGTIGYSSEKVATNTKFFYQTGTNDFPIENGQSDRLEHSEIKKWGVLQKNAFRLKANQQLDLNIWYQNSDRNLPPNLVQQISVAEQVDEVLRSSLNWKYTGQQSIIQLRNGFFYERLIFQDVAAAIDSRSRTWTNLTEIEWTKNLNKQNSFNIGANYTYIKAKATGFGEEQPTQNRAALFAMYHWCNQSKKWKTQLSFRQEWVDGKSTPFIPAIGFSGQVHQKIVLTGNVSRSYRIPTFNDLFWQLQGNQNLLAENGWNEEIGFAYQLTKNGQLKSTVYNRNVVNWILWQPENGVWRPNNLPSVWSRGVENIIKWEKSINNLKLTLAVNYDVTLSTNRKVKNGNDGSLGKQLIYVPKHKWNASFQGGFNSWTFVFYHQYTGKVYTLFDNSDALPAYHLDHFYLYKNLKNKKLEGNVFVKLNNIFGMNYQVITQFAMPKQNFEIGWQIGFF